MKAIVIHHNDADGRTSAAVVGRSEYAAGGVEYIEADYSKAKDKQWSNEIKKKCLEHEGPIFIVDFSMPEKWMLDVHLYSKGSLYWIDHHASCKDYSDIFAGLRNFKDKDESGCELAWRFCFPHESAPDIVRLVGDYDVWRLKEEDKSKPLITALDAYQYMPDSSVWNTLLGVSADRSGDNSDEYMKRRLEANDAVSRLVDEGRIMMKYKTGYCRGLLEQISFETMFHGHKMLALNVARQGSDAFGARFKQYDACLSFYYDGKSWTVSIYSEKIDCKDIAAKEGGGGHKGAAGWTCETLPFKPIL